MIEILATILRNTYDEVSDTAIMYALNGYDVVEVTPTIITVSKDMLHFVEHVTIKCEG